MGQFAREDGSDEGEGDHALPRRDDCHCRLLLSRDHHGPRVAAHLSRRATDTCFMMTDLTLNAAKVQSEDEALHVQLDIGRGTRRAYLSDLVRACRISPCSNRGS